MIHVVSDGSKPGFNLDGGMGQVLQLFTGYRWKKFGLFFSFLLSPPMGDWFNLAIGFIPQYHKTADEVRSVAVMLTVRCVLTVTVEFQMRFGARNPDAMARVIKKIMDDMEAKGITPVFEDQTGSGTMAKAIEDIAQNTPPKKEKLN